MLEAEEKDKEKETKEKRQDNGMGCAREREIWLCQRRETIGVRKGRKNRGKTFVERNGG